MRLGRTARILGLLGGIGAVVWAMRDRFVSMPLPRQSEPPVFRATSPSPAPAEHATDTEAPAAIDDLTEISGIGPVFAGRLRVAGIMTFAQLAEAGAARAAEVAQVPETRAEPWIAEARTRA